MLSVVSNTDLISKILHGALDTDSDTFNDQSIDVVDVCEPATRFLVWFNVFHGILHKLLDFFTMILDVFKSWHFERLVELDELIWWGRFSSPLIKWLLPLLHEVLHLVDVVLHFFD